jgi:hypothetical protein
MTEKVFHVRVDHSLGFFSFYDIPAIDYHEAEKIAKRQFITEFCGGNNETTFRGVKTKHSVSAYTSNKYEWQ